MPASTGNAGIDRYYVHTAALDWQTKRKAAQEQAIRSDFGLRAMTRWESVGY